MLKGVGCVEVYTNLFETSSASQVFKVGISVSLTRFPVGSDSLEVKKIIMIKLLWVIAATTGRFYEWVSVFLQKRPSDVFRGILSQIAVPEWFHNGFVYIRQNDGNQFRDITYTRSLTES